MPRLQRKRTLCARSYCTGSSSSSARVVVMTQQWWISTANIKISNLIPPLILSHDLAMFSLLCNLWIKIIFSDQHLILQYCNTSWNNLSVSQIWGHPSCLLCNSGRQHFPETVLQNGLSHFENNRCALHFAHPQLAPSRQSKKQAVNSGCLMCNSTNPAKPDGGNRVLAQNCKKHFDWASFDYKPQCQ